MKKTITLIAFAGIAAAAQAQSGSLSIVPSVNTLGTTGASGTMTLSIYGDADFGTAISGGGFGISAVGGSSITDMTASTPLWGELGFQDLGHAGDGNHNGLIFGQLIFPPFITPFPASLLGNGPVLLGWFQITFEANTWQTIDFTTTGGIGDFTLEIFDEATGGFTQLTGDISHGSASVVVTPAPSALALLGLGGLAAGRRRR